MERFLRLRQIADEFERLGRDMADLTDTQREAIIERAHRLTREMTRLLEERPPATASAGKAQSV